jgi:hypothetical protein
MWKWRMIQTASLEITLMLVLVAEIDGSGAY